MIDNAPLTHVRVNASGFFHIRRGMAVLFLSTLPDAVASLLEKMCEILFPTKFRTESNSLLSDSVRLHYTRYSCGGFNTPTLCVVTKGIKADCNHLMRTTYPDACVGVVDYGWRVATPFSISDTS